METVKKISLVQNVEQQLKEFIQGNEIEIGDKLPSEKILCEQLGVGRGTVREAIRTLQANGFVEIHQGRGAFVVQKTEPHNKEIADWFSSNEYEIKDILDLRSAIEPLAVKLAIQKCSSKEIDDLKKIQAQTETAVSRNDIVAVAKCDEKFHSIIFDYSRNKLLIDINKKIVNSLRTFRTKTFRIPHNTMNLIPAHAAILGAFETRDINAGQYSMSSHLALVVSDLEYSKRI